MLDFDAWARVTEQLHGPIAVPVVAWPADRARLVKTPDGPDDESDGEPEHIEQPPWLTHGDTRRRDGGASDAAVVAFLATTVRGVSATQLAAALQVHHHTAALRLKRMQAAGLVRRDGRAWVAAVAIPQK